MMVWLPKVPPGPHSLARHGQTFASLVYTRYPLMLQLRARNFTHITLSTVKWGPGGLVPTGEAAYPRNNNTKVAKPGIEPTTSGF